jgi:glycolate oxidase iron-sulfur subunit
MPSSEATGHAPQSLVDIQNTGKRSAFDAHHAPEQPVMDQCVHCGFCLPACPTYQLWGDEMDSPRGRIWLMRKASTGNAPLDTTFRTHIDQCLGCMACMTACPSGVEYNKLIEDTRGQVERNTPRSFSDRLFRWLLFATFPHPARLRAMRWPLAFYQSSGLQKLVRKSGLLKLLPSRLAAMEQLLPTVPLRNPAPTPAAATKPTRGRIVMLTGCVQDAFFPRVNAATERILRAAGYEVIVPEGQGCCGALHVHSGHDIEAAAYAKRLIAQLEAANPEIIAINAAGCGSTMKEYGHLLRDDPAWAERAQHFAAKCRDVSELLAPIAATDLSFQPLPLRIAYQDACHLRHAQGIYAQPRSLLSAIPQLDIAEIADANTCCGSAGVYNLLYPETAAELGDRKAAHVLDAHPQALVSANPGCLLQLQSALRRNGHAELPAFHTVEILDASLRGLSVDDLLTNRTR